MNSQDRCEAETVERDDAYEVCCKQHGLVFRYTTISICLFGARAVQQKIDTAWVTHAVSALN